jgi:hypothetical protein
MRTRRNITELIRFVVIILISFLMGYFLSEIYFGNSGLDIHMHDTYPVLITFILTIPITLFFIFGIYTFITYKNRFIINLVNWITVLSGIVLIVLLTFYNRIFVMLSYSGLTLYPPLSQLGANKFSELNPNPFFDFISKLTFSIQTIVLIVLLSITYIWGKMERKLIE